MKITFLTFLITLSTLFQLIAQTPQGNRPQGGRPQGQGGWNKGPAIGRLYGRVFEAGSKQTVPYASVVVMRSFGRKDSIIGGALTLENGDFNITDLPLGALKVKISFVGFKDFQQTVTLSQPDNIEMDLGNIRLESDTKVLKEVEVSAQKTAVQMSIDKKVFNVDKNITSTGGTAEDVLKNVPSVTVNQDGNAQLRNQSTTVYVDGRPTLLSLNQIASDQIEQVEVITNPSAKYEASATGGIINIVMKKNRKPGYNGMVNLGGGYPRRYNGMANLNIKEGRFNWTFSYNLNHNKNNVEGYTYRNTLDNGLIINSFNQVTDNLNMRTFQMGRIGLEYTLNNRNTLNFNANAHGGNFDDIDTQKFEELLIGKDTSYYGNRNMISNNQFRNYSLQTGWRKSFPKKGKELSADVTSNFSRGKNFGDWYTYTYLKGGVPEPNNPGQQQNTGSSKGSQVTFQLDFTNPINDSSKIEMGLRSFYNDRDQLFLADSVYKDATRTRISAQSVDLNTIEMVNAAYITYSSKIKGFGYQAGLRFEQSRLDGKSRLAGEGDFGYNYPSVGKDIFKAIFPSLYISKPIGEKSEFQINMSRKIQRPDFRQISPFIRQSDNKNISIGNPALRPEFITLAEMNYNHIFGSHNWLVSIYYRHREDPITNFTEVLNNGVFKNTFINGKSSDTYGLDNTLKLGFTKDIELTTNLNIYNQTIRTTDIERSGWSWRIRPNLNWKLPKSMSTQVTYEFQSSEIIAQGTQKSVQYVDFAFKKDFSKAASLTFAVNDIFNARRRVTILETESYVQESMRRREVRNFRLTFQYRFGKMDASLFGKRRNQQRQQDRQDDMDF